MPREDGAQGGGGGGGGRWEESNWQSSNVKLKGGNMYGNYKNKTKNLQQNTTNFSN